MSGTLFETEQPVKTTEIFAGDQEVTITQPSPAGTEVAVVQDGAQSHQLMSMIYTAALDPNVDPAKMVALADLALKLKTHEQQEEFNKDKLAALREMPIISKRGAIIIKNVLQSNFSRFEDIMRVVKPILASFRLAISFDVGSLNGLVTVTPILSHANGHVERGGCMALPLDSSGSKNGTQGVGSSIQYGKRYAAVAMLNIITDGVDNDGNGADDNHKNFDDEALAVITAGETAAQGGLALYEAWWKATPVETRRWVAASGDHARLKKIAEEAGN